jgi:hypothetical protein
MSEPWRFQRSRSSSTIDHAHASVGVRNATPATKIGFGRRSRQRRAFQS